MNDEIIGIPRGLSYYRYKYLWKFFFEELNIPYQISEKTNKQILENGKNLAQDEACLSLKIFLGHVDALSKTYKKILIPRIACVKKKEKMCTNFLVLPDLVRNLKDVEVIEFNVDEESNQTEEDAFIHLGELFHKSHYISKIAYQNAKKKEYELKKKRFFKTIDYCKTSNLKILVVAHDYNLEDDWIGRPITSFLKENGITVISSYPPLEKKKNKISPLNYWTENKDLLSSIELYHNSVDGIILISSFPCGPDSLTNEMIQRTVKDIPLLTIIIDEQNNNAGIVTRLESFLDILKMKGSVTNE